MALHPEKKKISRSSQAPFPQVCSMMLTSCFQSMARKKCVGILAGHPSHPYIGDVGVLPFISNQDPEFFGSSPLQGHKILNSIKPSLYPTSHLLIAGVFHVQVMSLCQIVVVMMMRMMVFVIIRFRFHPIQDSNTS